MPQVQRAHSQAYHRRAYCQIIVDGQDVTDKFDPYLISVQVIDNIDEDDQCNLELDDRNAELSIPEDGAQVQARLGWAGEGPTIPLFRHYQVDENGYLTAETLDQLPNPADIPAGAMPFEASGMLTVFNGYVHNVESGFARKGGGRRLWIEARGSKPKADDKSLDMKTWGFGAVSNESQGAGAGIPLSQVLGDAASKAGMGLKIAPEIGNISRDFWSQNGSVRQFAEQIAREVGGQVKISGNNLIVTGANDFVNVDGQQVPLIIVEWDTNLIAWRIKPYVARPQFGQARSKFFDLHKGAWESVTKGIGGSTPFGMSSATLHSFGAAPNKQIGEQLNGGSGSDSEINRGTGWVLFNGEPSALAGHQLQIIGARPGVDGNYKIKQAEHNYIRTGGYTTRCDLMKPSFTAGYENWIKQMKERRT